MWARGKVGQDERSLNHLWRRIGIVINDFLPQECQNYFCHDGYASS